jgi:glutaminyl-peptide cyclotransferase
MRLSTLAATAGLALAAALCLTTASAAAPVYDVHVVKAYPHDPAAFTEGLFYQGGFLYESTGLEGHSSIRKVALETGKVLQQRAIDSKYFGEGIVAWQGRLVELTWRSEIGFIYDLDSFEPRSSFRYRGEGWSLTHDGRRLIMDDGTPDIRFLDPTSLAETGRLHITCDGRPVQNLNELEWVKGEIYANIWQTPFIARIDPKTGHVVGWIDLSRLPAPPTTRDSDTVANGIAYDATHDRLFVTGKLWPQLYEVKLVPKAKAKPQDSAAICAAVG